MSKSSISTFELFQRFPDQESARLYFEAARWPDGAACPACGSSAQWPTVDPEDRLFWHPEHDGEEFTREEVLAIIGTPKRCTRTAEFDFGAPVLAEAA
ncbi:hypothetical protein SZ64_04270 [Erythrobacter sp. SG61-1L]|uniref:transposase n=1 Tax=Erythrobacter sp. SG61-1L TaxID=1603897 RepID=UPI0006C905EE|nr:transposase [Erythrobacter sp. SG61-1L]KPL67387.1 hypothetical protein SZ64_04270 [Erythrobacter sp. SG61-1L]